MKVNSYKEKKKKNQRSLLLVDATQCSDSSSEAVYMTKFKPMDQISCPLYTECTNFNNEFLGKKSVVQ